MGLMVEGKWQVRGYDTKKTGGRFVRKKTTYHDFVRDRPDAEFRAEPGRYHLYVSYACPWAHRTLIVRKLKKLEDAVSVSVVHPLMLEDGWEFRDGYEDDVEGKRYLREIYLEADRKYTGRVTVPVLWDKKKRTIVNNESAEIIRMLDSELADDDDESFYPEAHRDEIDRINERVYETLNNGVYKCGFASTQEAYDESIVDLFATMDFLEERLSDGRDWLVGDRLTEADIRLFTTLARFDHVYHYHFKCNRRRLLDYPHLARSTKRLYEREGVADTLRLDHITQHYYRSHQSVNPSGVVPIGPARDFRDL